MGRINRRKKILIVVDDISQLLQLQKKMTGTSLYHVAISEHEAIAVFRWALEKDEPFDRICLSLVKSNFDGLEVLRQIRCIEQEHRVGDSDQVEVVNDLAPYRQDRMR